MMHLAFALLCVQEKVVLELKAKEGYHYRVTKHQSEENDLTIRHDKDKPTRTRASARTDHVYTETILSTHNGKVTRVDRHYERAHDDFSDLETNKSASHDLPFAGHSVTLEATDQGTIIEKSDWDVSGRDLQQLQIKPDPITANLPTGAVAVGDDWTVPAAALTAEFTRQIPGFNVDKIEGAARLARIETWNGQRCGVVSAIVTLSARMPDGPAVSLRTEATMWLNLDRGVVVKIDATGKQSIGGSAEHSTNGRFEYDGSSSSRYTEEIVWLD